MFAETGTSDFDFDTFCENNPSEPGYTVPSNAPASGIDYFQETVIISRSLKTRNRILLCDL